MFTKPTKLAILVYDSERSIDWERQLRVAVEHLVHTELKDFK